MNVCNIYIYIFGKLLCPSRGDRNISKALGSHDLELEHEGHEVTRFFFKKPFFIFFFWSHASLLKESFALLGFPPVFPLCALQFSITVAYLNSESLSPPFAATPLVDQVNPFSSSFFVFPCSIWCIYLFFFWKNSCLGYKSPSSCQD